MNKNYWIKICRSFVFAMTFVISSAAVAVGVYGQNSPLPPAAPVRNVTDDYFGTKITDPYRWMEEPKSKELAVWMKAQSDHARAYLDRLPTREKLLAQFEAQNNAIVSISGVQQVGGRYFYFRAAPGDTDRKIFVRDGFNGEERLIVDPNEVFASTGKRFSIISFSPSPDGKFVAYLASAGGAELGEIRVTDAAAGKNLDDRIDETRWSAGSWLPDASGFLYVRFPNLSPDAAPTERFQKRSVYLHKLGDPAEKDKPVFGYGINADIELDPKLLPFPSIPYGSKYVFIAVNSGVSPNSAGYVARAEELGKPDIKWRRIANFDDEISSMAIRGDDLYLLSYKNAPRYKVIKTGLQNPDLSRAEIIVPANEAVTTNIVAAQDALYVQQKDGGNGIILRVDYKTNRAEKLALPFDGTISGLTADPREPGVTFGLDSWVRPKALYAFDAGQKTVSDTKLQPPLPIDVSNFESATVKVRSHDGTLIPLSIIYKKGLKRDGRNIAGMTGYGAYGISSEPRFAANFIPFIEAGGVVAFAHVRGGGEYGEEWHQAGFKSTKPNTWKDFIACAEYLIREKYTSPQLLAGHGASAGGIMIGNAIAERPDLFGAAIIGVGLNNMLRYETTANGVPNIPEYGSVKTEQGFRDLLAMDAFHKIRPGVKYPAVMLTHGINDPRVEPWLSAKMAARLQAATASEKPVLLRIDYDAGHGIGNSRRQMNEEFADIFSFIFEQLKTDIQGERVISNDKK